MSTCYRNVLFILIGVFIALTISDVVREKYFGLMSGSHTIGFPHEFCYDFRFMTELIFKRLGAGVNAPFPYNLILIPINFVHWIFVSFLYCS